MTVQHPSLFAVDATMVMRTMGAVGLTGVRSAVAPGRCPSPTDGPEVASATGAAVVRPGSQRLRDEVRLGKVSSCR